MISIFKKADGSAPDKDPNAVLDSVRIAARTFQAFIDLAALVEGIQSIENATVEANGSLSTKQMQVSDLDKTLADKNDALTMFNNKITDATNRAADIIAQARDTASKVRTEALKDADDVRSEAATNAATLTAKAAADAKAIDKTTSDNTRALGDLQNQVDAKTAELATLQADIDSAKATIAKILKA